MHDTLSGYLSKNIRASDFSIHYHIGDDFSGETDFRVKGNGEYSLWSTVTEGRQRRTYKGELPPSEVEELATKLLQADLDSVKHVHPRPGEDDPEATISIAHGNKKSQATLWTSEIRECPPFAAAQKSLLALVQRVSRGEVLEAGQ
jgi:hypothetical protein